MLCLCSQSHSRARLLQEAQIVFEQRSVEFDEESIEAHNAYDFVYLASKGKLDAAKAQVKAFDTLLCADSVIATKEGEILRKPMNEEEAYAILRKQSGSEIAIVTCVHLYTPQRLFVDMSATHFIFAPFDEAALKAYVQSGEWRGKAGGCMVEGFCKPFIREMRGLESTARGLQTEIIKAWLK